MSSTLRAWLFCLGVPLFLYLFLFWVQHKTLPEGQVVVVSGECYANPAIPNHVILFPQPIQDTQP